ncbi:MAG: hypothetical protein ACO32J_00670, partial [Phycisphaerales bacterium]
MVHGVAMMALSLLVAGPVRDADAFPPPVPVLERAEGIAHARLPPGARAEPDARGSWRVHLRLP